MSNAPIIRVVRAGKSYGQGATSVHSVDEVTLDVRPGELAVITGPSGSGKSTLLSMMSGLLRPTRGHVELCGHDLGPLSEGKVTEIRRRHVAFVFQAYHLFPALTARQNVALALRMKQSMRDAAALARAGEVLARVGLAARAEHRPEDLSGGEKQRVAIARALAAEHTILFGDEPTAALDSKSAIDIAIMLKQAVTPTNAVVLVTHDRRLERFADRLVTMEDGRVLSDSHAHEARRVAHA